MAISRVSPTDPIKLVCLPKMRVVVSFPKGLQGRAVFSPDYKHLEIAMKTIGLTIPVGQEKSYEHLKKDQRRIYLEDPDFGMAFYELYYRATMDPDQFRWQPL
jgi:hypothetical protein